MKCQYKFPFYYDHYIIENIKLLIPNDHMIDTPIDYFTDNQIETIKKYFAYTFNLTYSECDFRGVTDVMDRIYKLTKAFKRYDMIIAPGDSPSVYVQTIKYLGLYEKPIIVFPISGLSEPDLERDTIKDLLHDYLIYIFKQNYNIQSLAGLSIGIFDHSDTQVTQRLIIKGIKQLYGGDVVIKPIYWPTYLDMPKNISNMFIQSEDYGIRSIKYFPLGKSTYTNYYFMDNLRRFNVLIIMLALAYYDKLKSTTVIQLSIPDVEKGIYKARIYSYLSDEETVKYIEYNPHSSRRQNYVIIEILKCVIPFKFTSEFKNQQFHALLFTGQQIDAVRAFSYIYDIKDLIFIPVEYIYIKNEKYKNYYYKDEYGIEHKGFKLSKNYYIDYEKSNIITYPKWLVKSAWF